MEKIFCNSDKTFYDRNQSRKHLRTIANLSTEHSCLICDRSFCSAGDLAIPNLSAADVKVVRVSRENDS